jgi:pimeloyl-ACP methyl ester carboxylesterase
MLSPAQVSFGEEEIAALHRSVRRSAPARFPLAGRWTFGTGGEVVDRALRAWSEFDVEAFVERLNAVPQVDLHRDEVTVRAFHLRGERDDALPLLLTHGWPSTVLEPLSIAGRLASPSREGGEAGDSFHVVVPAMPGFPLSTAPASLEHYTAAHTADVWAELMTALGYEAFVASAGDIGARVTAWLGARHGDRVLGVHLTSNALETPPGDAVLSEAEAAWLGRCAEWDRLEGAYAHVQRTKPLSLGHALGDSPAGLAAWVLEKWHGWGDGVEDVFVHYDADELLGHLSLYWLTRSASSSLVPYVAYDRPPGPRPPAGEVRAPASFYLAPAENAGVPPRELAERQYDVARWSELPRGGHFLASEEPDLLVADIRDAFRASRRSVT